MQRGNTQGGIMSYSGLSGNSIMRSRYQSWLLVVMVVLVASAVSCSPRSALIGKWQAEDGSTMEFLRDGTVMTKAMITITGKYSILDNMRIKVEYQGLLGLVGPQIFEIKVRGGQLTLTDSNGVVAVYTAVK